MKQISLIGNSVKLVVKENVLAVISDKPLSTASSAIHNGGFKKIKTLLNIGVPEDYSDRSLHQDPEAFIAESSKKLEVTDDFIAMITAATITNYSLVAKKEGNLTVTVVATAGCKTHAESAGENINTNRIEGTINIIVLIDGNPADSCLAATLLTATEAKTAALKDLDIRSWYTGDAATGTITDSVVAASTNRGHIIGYGGPASKLGNLVGHCTRKAVKEAIFKQDGCLPSRSIVDRLRERHLSIEKLASELSKVHGLSMDVNALEELLRSEPLFASALMAAAKMDEDAKKGLVPPEFGSVDALSKNFGDLLSTQSYDSAERIEKSDSEEGYDSVDLPPFTKQVLINIVKAARSRRVNENLK
jgi:adenosylcobinamide amidohydrolase